MPWRELRNKGSMFKPGRSEGNQSQGQRSRQSSKQSGNTRSGRRTPANLPQGPSERRAKRNACFDNPPTLRPWSRKSCAFRRQPRRQGAWRPRAKQRGRLGNWKTLPWLRPRWPRRRARPLLDSWWRQRRRPSRPAVVAPTVLNGKNHRLQQGWEVQGISMMQTLHLEPIFHFFGGQTLNLKPVFFSWKFEVWTLNLKPQTYSFFPEWSNLEPQTFCRWNLLTWGPWTSHLRLENGWSSIFSFCTAKWTDSSPSWLWAISLTHGFSSDFWGLQAGKRALGIHFVKV